MQNDYYEYEDEKTKRHFAQKTKEQKEGMTKTINETKYTIMLEHKTDSSSY